MTKFEPFTPKIVLAVGAHADDIDFGASGSVARWAQEGAEVHYLVITDGSKGSSELSLGTEELVARREQEQREAIAELGAKEAHFLGYEDAMLEVTLQLKKDIVRVIRKVRPDTVIVMDPTVAYVAEYNFINHPDHRATGQATLDAVFPLARDQRTFPELYSAEGLEPHKVAHILLINMKEQNYYVDITGTFEAKITGLMKHISQIGDQERVVEMLRARAAEAGRKTGSRYAEGFMRIDCSV